MSPSLRLEDANWIKFNYIFELKTFLSLSWTYGYCSWNLNRPDDFLWWFPFFQISLKGSYVMYGLCVFWAFLISSPSGPGDRVGEVGSYVPHRPFHGLRLFSCCLSSPCQNGDWVIVHVIVLWLSLLVSRALCVQELHCSSVFKEISGAHCSVRSEPISRGNWFPYI